MKTTTDDDELLYIDIRAWKRVLKRVNERSKFQLPTQKIKNSKCKENDITQTFGSYGNYPCLQQIR